MKKQLWSWSLILASLVAGLYLRVYPVFMTYFDKKAAQDVYREEGLGISDQISRDYPQMEKGARARLSAKVFEENLKKDRPRLARKIAQRSDEMKDRYRDERGRPYLAGIDSYYWFRLLNNLLSTGQIAQIRADGVLYDDLTRQPIDPSFKNNAHLWLGFLFYRVGSYFSQGLPLEATLFFVPLVLSCVIAIFSFFVARRLGANDLGAFMASIAVNLSPFLVMRVASEWFDTDVYNALFPLLIFGAFLYACGQMNRPWRRLVFCAIAGLLCAFYASTWKGWWFIFDIIILSTLLYLLNLKMSQKEENLPGAVLRHYAVCLGLFFSLASLSVVLLNGFGVWGDCLLEPLRLASILKVTEVSSWPNVFLTVAELGSATAADIIRHLGGQLVFFGGLCTLLYIFLFERGLRDTRYGLGLLCLAIWIPATFYAALEAFRFSLLLVVPVGLAFGVAVSKLYEGVCVVFSRYLKDSCAQVARAGFVFILAIYPIVNFADVHGRLSVPLLSMGDEWRGVLTKIKNETPESAVINSWWDFGHWFTAIGDRRVLFDGMTQNTPYAYWMASALLTDDPVEFLGIVRMMNASGNQAVDELTRKDGLFLPDAVSLARRCLAVSKKEARAILDGVLPVERATIILDLLFPAQVPPVYMIVSSDMPAKISPISYIGNWDFTKVDLWFKHQRFSKEEFIRYAVERCRLTPQGAEDYYLEILFVDKKASRGWFSRQLDYYSPLGSARQDDEMLYFDNMVAVNTKNWHAFIQSPDPRQRGVPQSVFFMEGGVLREVAQEKPDLPYSVILFKEDGATKSLLCDTELAKSMLIRMYFYQAEGLKFLKLFDRVVDDAGHAIYVYEVVWPAMTGGNQPPKDEGRRTRDENSKNTQKQKSSKLKK